MCWEGSSKNIFLLGSVCVAICPVYVRTIPIFKIHILYEYTKHNLENGHPEQKCPLEMEEKMYNKSNSSSFLVRRFICA